MHRSPFWPLVLVLLFTCESIAANKTLFEAYYKIISSNQHVGYYIQRYELDPIKKQFISIYFLRTNGAGGNISESLKAYSTDKLNPIKYNYTSLQGTLSKTIDAIASKNKKGVDVLQVKTTENGKLRVSERKLDKGTFFSTFLIYLLLQGKKGIQPGVKYSFKAVAEEDGKEFPGEVYVDSETKYKGLDTYKVLYTFKNAQFVNFINKKGESLNSISPALGLSAEMVSDPSEATKGMTFNEKSLKLLFGDVPKGKTHQLAGAAPTPEKSQ
ncbi:MAG: hypothetical protein KDD33_01565 [Bdellovibrionales bacterium]|nr:hypothetical protein [Bdellovibrionales bacterium]